MRQLRLSRRALLKGCGGAALALPWLEVMDEGRAHAQARPSPLRTAPPVS